MYYHLMSRMNMFYTYLVAFHLARAHWNAQGTKHTHDSIACVLVVGDEWGVGRARVCVSETELV